MASSPRATSCPGTPPDGHAPAKRKRQDTRALQSRRFRGILRIMVRPFPMWIFLPSVDLSHPPVTGGRLFHLA